MPVSAVEPVHPLAGAYIPGRDGPAPLRIGLPAREAVQVLARRGADIAGAAAAMGVTLPGPGQAVVAADLGIAWIQPGGWMVSAPRAGEGALLARLAPLGAAAALVDQSHGRTTLTLSGPSARGVLAKGCRIDLHPREFGPGRAAATQVAHLSALLVQTGPMQYEVTVFSTLVENLLEWLSAAAGPDGCLPG